MSEHFFKKLDWLKQWIDRIAAVICISIVAIMTVLVTYQVIVRYLFNSPSAVSEVISRYLFIWLILFAGAYVFGLREHMAIPYVKEKFSAEVQIIFDMFSELIIVIFAIFIMMIGGYSSAMRQMSQMSSAVNIPIGVIYAAIPVSGCLIAFYFVYNELSLLRRFQILRRTKVN